MRFHLQDLDLQVLTAGRTQRGIQRSLQIALLAAALSAASLLPTPASASPVWQENTDLQSTLAGTPGYTSDAGTRTAVVSYTNQTATNTGASSGHFGMYLAWAWSYAGSGASTALLWDDSTQAFVGGDVSLSVSRPGFGAETLHLGDVLDDTWIGQPWAAYPGDTPIASQAAWDVPFLDFGQIAAGAGVNYDLTLSFSFANDAAFDDWNRAGSFYIGGLGVRALPEPGSLALAGLALAALGALRRRKVRA